MNVIRGHVAGFSRPITPAVQRPEYRRIQKVVAGRFQRLRVLHTGAEYDAWLIKIGDGDQFGSGFMSVNPNSKIPALLDRSGPKPIRVFESGAILMHLAEKFGAFLPTEIAARAECLSWLFWQMGSAPYLGGGFGHFYAYAPTKIEYAIDRFAMESIGTPDAPRQAHVSRDCLHLNTKRSVSLTCSTSGWRTINTWRAMYTRSPI